MASPLRIYSRVPMDWNASIYYRLLLPMRAMFKTGNTDISIDRGSLELDTTTRGQLQSFSSVNWFYQPISSDVTNAANDVRNWPSYWRSESEWDVAPNFVLDTDDDILSVEPSNPAFSNLGWQVDGVPLEDDAVITTDGPEGKQVVMYTDGERDFHVKANKSRIAQYKKMLHAVDLITCSTRNVEQYVQREVPGANTLIFPNCINFEDYPKVELAKHPDEVRILWQGAPTHYPELLAIKDSIKRIHDKYPQTTWYFWGGHYEWLYKDLDPSRVTILPWVDYYEFKLRLSMLNFDINIAPLSNTKFNRCRSAIKMYEAAAVWNPAPTLAENTAQFSEDIIEGETGFLYNSPDEFELKLGGLIEDEALRRRVGLNAKDWLRTERDINKYVPNILEAFTKLREARRNLVGPPPVALEDTPNVEPVSAE